MMHHPVEYGRQNHYGVSPNGDLDHVLLQIQDDKDQARIVLTIEETEHVIALLQAAINKINRK